MKYVNEALCGMWHEVALGETGSLVVQNIFENCLEEDKVRCWFFPPGAFYIVASLCSFYPIFHSLYEVQSADQYYS